jgi:hypothetical protein
MSVISHKTPSLAGSRHSVYSHASTARSDLCTHIQLSGTAFAAFSNMYVCMKGDMTGRIFAYISGDCLLWAIVLKMTEVVQIFGYFCSTAKVLH